jgi:hypothetical protein
MVVGPGQQRRFTIDLSKFEYTQGKLSKEIDHFQIFVYAPEMIAIEKLRAICQQCLASTYLSPQRQPKLPISLITIESPFCV